MSFIKPDVATYCMGQAASAAAVLLAAGAAAKRFALPHSRVMLHQPHGGVEGQATDIEIQAREFTRVKEEMNQMLALHTGQPVEKIRADTDRDFWMTAEEAKAYGLVDEVLEARKLRSVT